MRGYLCIFFFLCFGISTNGFAQKKYEQIGEYKFPARKDFVRIPFNLIHNLIVIPVQINGSRPLNFVVDTGVETSMLTDLSFIDSLTLLETRPLKLRGLGVGSGMEALASAGNLLQFAGIEASNQSLLVLLDNVFDLSNRLGVQVHGIIGHSLFKNFVVEVNYATKQLTLYKPGTYPEKRARKGTVLPLIIEDTKPYVLASVTLTDGTKYPLRLIVDSGMSNPMLLYLPTMGGWALPGQKIDAYIGKGLNGDIFGHIGRVTSLNLGDYVLHNPPVSFPDSSAIEFALKLKNRNGNLGADILKRFRVVFDYANSKMLLLPNPHYEKPFYFNLSGLELVAPFPGIQYYTVASVLPNSPAHKAGLQKGDALTSINGVNCHERTLAQVLSFFESKPGKKIKIKAKRESKEINAVLALQDII